MSGLELLLVNEANNCTIYSIACGCQTKFSYLAMVV